jgi:hypothetical protein
MAMLIGLLIFFGLVIVICIFLTSETNGDSLIVAVVCGLICWAMLENKTTRTADPVAIDRTELSVMVDNEVAIIRYNGTNYTYDNVSEYRAIKDSTFSLMRIQEFDVFGKDNGSTYELRIDETKDICLLLEDKAKIIAMGDGVMIELMATVSEDGYDKMYGHLINTK